MQNSIDQLPDEMLISILSFLPTKEAARTCSLARRWRSLWPKITNLNFDGSKMIHKLRNTENLIDRCSTISEDDANWIKRKMLKIERIAFVRDVNAALASHSSETIDEFKVFSDLDCRDFDDIDRWIESALAKRVKRLELKLVQSVRSCTSSYPWGRYVFPSISSPIETLVSLCMTQVHIERETLEHYICDCPFLEELSVTDSSGFEKLRPNRNALRLRSLAIVHCRGFMSLAICSPNLVSCMLSTLSVEGFTVSLNRVSSLIHLSLEAEILAGFSRWLFDVSGSLSRLETLTLQTDSKLVVPQLDCFPFFLKFC